MVPIQKLMGPLWEALQLELGKYLPRKGMLKATVWAGRHPSQGHVTFARLCPGGSGTGAAGQMGACWLVLPQVGIHSSICRQTQQTRGKTWAGTSPDTIPKGKALTPFGP